MTKPAISVRTAQPDDSQAIAGVHIGTWQSAYRGLMPDAFLDGLSVEQRVRGWRRALTEGDPGWPDQLVWVAELERRIIGFCCAGPCRDGDATRDTGEIYAIYVDSAHWDTGAGAALMRTALDELRMRFGRATLWVLDTNARGRRFYEKGGWSQDGAEKIDTSRGFPLRELRYRISL